MSLLSLAFEKAISYHKGLSYGKHVRGEKVLYLRVFLKAIIENYFSTSVIDKYLLVEISKLPGENRL